LQFKKHSAHGKNPASGCRRSPDAEKKHAGYRVANKRLKKNMPAAK